VETVYELPLLQNNTRWETFLHKSGAVWSVDWTFIIRAPAWRWLGEYVTLGRTFYNLRLEQEIAAAAAPVTSDMFFLIAFLEEAFIRNDIIFMQRINYIYNLIIICINSNNVVSNNNTVINNNYRRFQDLILLLKIPTEMRKGLKVFCKECKR